ncbi:unnamed protein product [Lactuca saligna]|uniref:Uncharacterized protein n=1 Tax=Lactuca saligna TaxID=75948 RepID=A0AA36EKP7_LACSI|nr:unnamed protein product [Lactuca saligna]
MLSTKKEEDTEIDAMEIQLQDGNHIHAFYSTKFQPSLDEMQEEEAEKQKYQLLTLARSRIKEDIAQLKADEHQINRKLMWFTQQDQYIQWKKQEINNLESYLCKVEPHLPTNSVPRTTGFLHLSEKDAVRADRKRYQKRLIKKGRMDVDYLHQVKEELLCLKKCSGMTSSCTQEIKDLMESMAQRIQHGNKNRLEEMRIYLEMRNLKETRDIYTSPDPDECLSNCYSIPRRPSNYDVELKRATQHKINIRLDDIEEMTMDLKGRKARVTRLKADMELVRKSICCLQKELEDVNTKRIKAFKRACELGEQKKGLVQ